MRSLVGSQMIEKKAAQDIVGLICLYKGIPVPEIQLQRAEVLKNGNIVLGEYQRRSKRIYLSRKVGLTVDTLLHELAHHFVATTTPTKMTHGTVFGKAEEEVWKTYHEAISWWNVEAHSPTC